MIPENPGKVTQATLDRVNDETYRPKIIKYSDVEPFDILPLKN